MSTATAYGSPGINYRLPPGADRMPDQPFFTRSDLAVIGARVQGVESMRPETISQHLFESREQIPLQKGGTRRGKFVEDKFPAPDGYLGKAPWWAKSREQEIVDWFQRHPRRFVGDGIGGRKPKAERGTKG